jgi:hypothetical protein
MIDAPEAMVRAQEASSLTYHGKPFHALLSISQPSDASSPFRGTVEIFWQAANKYRIVLTSPAFSRTLIVNGRQQQEANTGDYYPIWLRSYVTALMDPFPHAVVNSNGRVAIGPNMSSCLQRDDRPGGITDEMTRASVCFRGLEPTLHRVQSFTYFMEFRDSQSFGKKQIARTYQDYLKGNDPVVGILKTLEPLPPNESLFVITNPTPPADRIETAFISTKEEEALQQITVSEPWPTVGDGKTEGYMIIHVQTDRTGQVREAYKHNSDNSGLEAAGVQRALKYKFKPLLQNGVSLQMETPLVLHFTSTIANAHPVPVLTGEQLATVTTGCGTANLPSGLAPKGTVFKIRFSVAETGKVAGEVYPQNVPSALTNAAYSSLTSCKFRQYMVDGKPSYYHADFIFVAP